MISLLRPLIPGAEHWPRFMRNRSEQFEGRLVMAAVSESPSVLLCNMAGSHFPIAVAHGEGLAHFEGEAQYQSLVSSGGVAMRYVDGYGAPTERYPANPSGSPGGVTGITSMDGRALIMMPHPERLSDGTKFRTPRIGVKMHRPCGCSEMHVAGSASRVARVV